MTRFSRAVGVLAGVVLVSTAVAGLALAETVYATAQGCVEATQRSCVNTGYGWKSASIVPPENIGIGELPYDDVMRVHQERAMNTFGTPNNPVVAVDMNQVTFSDAQPYLDPEANRIRVPIRFVSEQMGAQVDWVQETRTVTITHGELTIRLRVDEPTATVNGMPITLDAPPTLIPPGRVMVPLRFISEAFGATVDWVGKDLGIKGHDWGHYQIWIWVPWGYWGSVGIHDRLEVYHGWYYR